MKFSAIAILMLASFIVTAFVSSCGDDKGGCTSLCKEIEPKLIEQLPELSPGDIRCSESPWTEASTCEECQQVLIDLYSASFIDGGICQRHFD